MVRWPYRAVPLNKYPNSSDFTVGSAGAARAATRNVGRIAGAPPAHRWRTARRNVGAACLGSGRSGSVRLEA